MVPRAPGGRRVEAFASARRVAVAGGRLPKSRGPQSPALLGDPQHVGITVDPGDRQGQTLFQEDRNPEASLL